jgi:hypothetical protein
MQTKSTSKSIVRFNQMNNWTLVRRRSTKKRKREYYTLVNTD